MANTKISAATVDHKGVLRGRCTLCTCLGYREAKDSNKYGKCLCPSSVHEAMSGCVGSEACKCTQYVQVAKTNDCYTCGHVAKDHKGLGRVAVEAIPFQTSSAASSAGRTDGPGTSEQRATRFSEMLQANKAKRKQSTDSSFSAGVHKKGKWPRDPNTPAFRKSIKIQLKRPKYMRGGKKKTYVDVDEQKQVLFGKVATMENVLKICAREFLKIDESRYEEEVSARNLDLFLLDGKARVTDETYTYNKTSFNFCYLKPSDKSYGDLSNTSWPSGTSLLASGSKLRRSGMSACSKKSAISVQDSPSTDVPTLGEEEPVIELSKNKLLQVGRSIYPKAGATNDQQDTMYRVLTFDVTTEAWQALGYLVVSRESMDAFAVGGMRMAFRAKLAVENKNPLLSDFKVGDDIVIKDYINTIKDQANEKGRNLRKMAMKEVQTQMVVAHLAKQFKQMTKGILDETPDVIPCFILEGKDAGEDEDVFMMEAALSGKFEKYLGNDGTSTIQGLNSAHGKICLAFAHWTFHFTEEALVVTDLQGVKLRLTDVEVATAERGYFGIGNLGSDAITTFKAKHVCNDICKKLGLQDLNEAVDIPKSKFQV